MTHKFAASTAAPLRPDGRLNLYRSRKKRRRRINVCLCSAGSSDATRGFSARRQRPASNSRRLEGARTPPDDSSHQNIHHVVVEKTTVKTAFGFFCSVQVFYSESILHFHKTTGFNDSFSPNDCRQEVDVVAVVTSLIGSEHIRTEGDVETRGHLSIRWGSVCFPSQRHRSLSAQWGGS